MPTYEFKCLDCENKFEVFTSISRKDQSKCPKCGSSNLKQLLSCFYVSGSEKGSSSTSSCNTCTSGTCSTCSLGD
ncbi:zinc ribbon domain-containing protein [bacterium]|nr:zinc ribbon domain-containing protein [bacterium]